MNETDLLSAECVEVAGHRSPPHRLPVPPGTEPVNLAADLARQSASQSVAKVEPPTQAFQREAVAKLAG